MAWLTILLSCLVAFTAAKPKKDYILKLSVDCGKNKAADAPELKIVTDVAISAIANCSDKVHNFESTDKVHYILPSSLTAGGAKTCLFNKRAKADTYSVEVEIFYGEPGSLILTKQKMLTAICTYSDYGKDGTAKHSIIETIQAPREEQFILGPKIASGDLSLSIQTVLDEDVKGGSINLDRFYSVFGQYTGARKDVALKPVSCAAISSSGDRYEVLRAGCGDGLIFNRQQGFEVKGKTFRSPYFQAFFLGRDKNLAFDCNVTLCSGACDGSSCETVCGKVTTFNITNTNIASCEGIGLNDECTVVCDPGYNQAGDGISTCGLDGIWTTPNIVCTPKDCGQPPVLGNGTVKAPATVYPNIATYTCNAGYDLSASANISCLTTGSWDRPPTCIPKDCGPVGSVSNGSISAPLTTYPNTAVYTCDAGHKLVGTSPRPCQANGKWAAAPTCQPKDCLKPTAPLNGSVVAPSTVYPYAATFSCDAGFNLNGNASVNCLASGSWDTAPTCSAKDCGKPTAPTNGSVNATSTVYPNVATFACDVGFNLNGNVSVDCLASGSWGTAPTCSAKDCGKPTAPTDGSVNATSTVFPNVAKFSCDPGYTLVGSSSVNCQSNGTWEAAPTCRINDCGSLSNPPYGTVKFTTTTFGSIATYTCATGYQLGGSSSVTCQANSTWETAPTCTIRDCGVLTRPSNGNVSVTTTTYNSVATFTCNPGYTLNGNKNITCAANGRWPRKPVCAIKRCGLLSDIIPNWTRITYSNGQKYTSKATIYCKSGYRKSQAGKATCDANAQWSPNITCIGVDCGIPANLTNGLTVASSTLYPSNADLTCNKGYNYIGKPKIKCQTNRKWSSANACRATLKYSNIAAGRPITPRGGVAISSANKAKLVDGKRSTSATLPFKKGGFICISLANTYAVNTIVLRLKTAITYSDMQAINGYAFTASSCPTTLSGLKVTNLAYNNTYESNSQNYFTAELVSTVSDGLGQAANKVILEYSSSMEVQEIEIYPVLDAMNLALGKPTAASTVSGSAAPSQAVDGLYTGGFHSQTKPNNYFCVDLGSIRSLSLINIFNRNGGYYSSINRLDGYNVRIAASGGCDTPTYYGTTECHLDDDPVSLVYSITGCQNQSVPFSGRYVFIGLSKNQIINFREIEVYSSYGCQFAPTIAQLPGNATQENQNRPDHDACQRWSLRRSNTLGFTYKNKKCTVYYGSDETLVKAPNQLFYKINNCR